MSPASSFPKTPTDEKPAMYTEPYVADSKDPAYSPPRPGMKISTGTSFIIRFEEEHVFRRSTFLEDVKKHVYEDHACSGTVR